MTDYRDEALRLVEEGVVTADYLLLAALKYMSQDEVADMLACNLELPRGELEHFFEGDDDFALEEDF